MEFTRSAGVLLHIGSLPGRYGIGDLGRSAFDFVDWLKAAKQSWWQILPLGPANDLPLGRRHDVYSSQSSWAGSPLYVSLDDLVRCGDLQSSAVKRCRTDRGRINYPALYRGRREILACAAERFFTKGRKPDRDRFAEFCRREAHWLKDWSLFAAAKSLYRGQGWWEFPASLAKRDPETLRAFGKEHAALVRCTQYVQYRFFEQWDRLKAYADQAGIGLIGDVPIYCAADSCEVWSAPHMFKLRANGRPRAEAGVPPDYFAEDGQLWGCPVYDWKAHRQDNFRWWIWRIRGCLRTVDALRIDHFRGFQAYWEIPAPAKNARGGKWVPGPGDAFLAAVHKALGATPFIAEDLGVITGAVNELRQRWKLPGMRVLQFAFSGNPRSCHLPMWHPRDCVVYPGTHDNDTARGWYRGLDSFHKDVFRRYTGSTGKTPQLDLLRYAYGSVANLAVAPIQDILGLDSAARLNTPGRDAGNYLWKLKAGQLKQQHARLLAELTGQYSRAPITPKHTDRKRKTHIRS